MTPDVGGITGKQRRQLRALAHSLKPVVIVGQRGLSDAVLSQIDGALTAHELIKVKLGADAPVERGDAAEIISSRTGCEPAGAIGRVLILYRRHPEHPKIRLVEGAKAGSEGGSTDELGGSNGSL